MSAEANIGYVPRGIIVPIVTPALVEYGIVALDKANTQQLFNLVVDRGADAIFGLATTGEASEMTQAQRLETMIYLAEAVGQRQEEKKQKVPLLLGVSAPTLSEVVQLTRAADSLNVDGVVIAPLLVEDAKTNAIVDAIAGSTGSKVIFYNNPKEQGGASLHLGTIFEAIEKHPDRIGGAKDSSMMQENKDLLL